MIILPLEFTTTNKIPPGYAWNMKEQKLYSFKIDGILKPMLLHKSGYKPWYQKAINDNYYIVSHKGRRKMIFERYLLSIVDDYQIHEVKMIS